MGDKIAGFHELTSSGELCIETLAGLAIRAEQSIVSPEWIVVDAVTAVEVHVDRAISALVARSGVSDNSLGQALLAKLGDDMNKSWPARYEWLSTGFGVTLKGRDFERRFDIAVECRNAIVHGSGRLTKRQQSGFAKFTDLRRRLLSVLEVEVQGVSLVLSKASASKVLTVSRAYVLGFDRAVLAQVPVDF